MSAADRISILLVEDEVIIALAESIIVEGFGYDVLIAGSGEEAVELAASNDSIGLILMDIDLGQGIDGTEAAQKILSIRNVPILFLTSHNERGMVEKVRGLTRYGYVLKNCGDFVLQSSIEMAFELFDAHQKSARTMSELQTSEFHYRTLIETMNDGVVRLNAGGKIMYANDTFCAVTGYSLEELIGKDHLFLIADEHVEMHRDKFKDRRAGVSERYETELQCKNGETVPFLLSGTPLYDNAGAFDGIIGVFTDITVRKRLESRQRLTIEILRRLNATGNSTSLVGDIISLIKRSFHLDAVGLRYRSGNDFPYYEQDGFSDVFLKQETFLCARRNDGTALVDEQGTPLYECTCGVVVAGKTDPATQYFTEGGSFWTNSSTDLLTLTPDKDPRFHPRNTCIHTGYNSIALIPLRSGDEIIGLLQLNARQENMFTPDLIQYFEGLTSMIAVALKRIQEEEALEESREKYRILFESEADAVLLFDRDSGGILETNAAASDFFGYSYAELTATNASALFTEPVESVQTRESQTFRAPLQSARKKNGSTFPVELEMNDLQWKGRACILATVRDITGRVEEEMKTQRHLTTARIVNEAVSALVGISGKNDAFRIAGTALHKLLPEAYLIISTTEPEGTAMRIGYLHGFERFLDPIKKLIGKDPLLMSFPVGKMEPEEFVLYHDGILHRFETGLYGLSFQTVPRVVCTAIERLLGIGEFHCIGFSWNGIQYGGTVIGLPKGVSIREVDAIETIVRQTTIAYQRVLAEEELRENERRLRMSNEVGNIGTLFFDTNANTIHHSPEMLHILGLKKGTELKVDETFDFVHSDDRIRFTEAFTALMAQQDDTPAGLEFRIVRPNGETRWVSLMARRAFIDSPAGRSPSHQIVAVCIDLTERKRVEEALIISHQRLENASRAGKIALWEWDIERDTMEWSDIIDPMLGFGLKEFPRTREAWVAIMHPDDRERVFATMQNQTAKDEPYQFEYRVRRSDGEYLCLHMVGNSQRNSDGNVMRMAGACIDVTERRQAEERIQHLLAEKEILLREVHHRIKNNMNTIVSLLSIHAEKIDNPEAIAALQSAKSRVLTMLVLYDKLYRAKDFRTISTRNYLEALIDEIVAIFPERETVTVVKRVEDFKLGTDVLFPLGIIMNEVLSNTMKHAFKKGKENLIEVSAGVLDARAVIVIRDNGIGMPESATSNSPGFGLQLVTMLAKQIGGSVRFEYQAGTIFTLEFGL
jgi:PAS domain S-box-containing protein